MVTIVEVQEYSMREGIDVSMIKMSGMEGAAIDYAIHGHAVAHIPLGQSEIQCVVSHRDEKTLDLLLHMPDENHLILPRRPVYVHFEINHKYFDGLHKAIDGLNQDTVSKLLPEPSIMQQFKTKRRLTKSEMNAIKHIPIDSEYQMNAIERMISSDSRVPFLVIGPFGTGKTHILTASVSALLCNSKSQILVCAHQHQCANGIYQVLYKKFGHQIMRLVPNDQGLHRIVEGRDCVILIKSVRENPHLLHQKRVIVTTFLTATNLPQLKQTANMLQFSHIMIDEGAQTREPEALGALAIAKPETKIIIVGDNKQVSIYEILVKYV